jgi:hypothetical protein
MQPTRRGCSKENLGGLYRLKLLHGACVFALPPHDLAFTSYDFWHTALGEISRQAQLLFLCLPFHPNQLSSAIECDFYKQNVFFHNVLYNV